MKSLAFKEQEILWLLMSFGFLGALPQIMKRSGIRYFLTTKMGWNDADQQPDDTFLWEGIDGSRVTGLYITTKNYEHTRSVLKSQFARLHTMADRMPARQWEHGRITEIKS